MHPIRAKSKTPPKHSSLAETNAQAPRLLCMCPWRWLIGILLLSVAVLVVDDYLGWANLLNDWRQAHYPSLILAIGLYLASHVARAMRINLQVLDGKLSTLLPMLKISSLHQAANNLLPMRMGELALPLLMQRYYAQNWSAGLSRLLWLRVYDLLIMGVITVTTISYLFFSMAASVAMGSLCLVLMIGIVMAAKQILRVITNTCQALAKIGKTLVSTAPATQRQNITLCLITLCAWGFKLCAVMVAIQALTPIPLATAFSGALGAEFGALLPIHGVAGAGTFEASFVGATKALTETTPDILAAAVNTHIFMLITTCSLAAACSVYPIPRQRQ